MSTPFDRLAAEAAAEASAASEPVCDKRPVRPVIDDGTRALLGELVVLQKKARAEPTDESEVVSPALRGLLPRMKHTSREIIRRLLGTFGNRTTACGEALSQSVAATLSEAGVISYDVNVPDYIGSLNSMRIDAATGSPARWIASTAFMLPCWSDGSVYVFEESTRGPVLAMAIETNGYTKIGDAQGGGVEKLSPPDPHGGYFLVAADWVPRCGPGTFRGLQIRVFGPSASPDHPKRLFQYGQVARLEDLVIHASENGFAARFLDSDPIDFPRARVVIRSYQRIGGRFVRVQPFADEARDYPVEWANRPWPEASKLCVNGKAAELEPWHRRFNETFRAVLKEDDQITFEQQVTGTDGSRIAVTFDCDNTSAGHHAPCRRLPGDITFSLVKDGEGWLIDSISDSPATKPTPR